MNRSTSSLICSLLEYTSLSPWKATLFWINGAVWSRWQLKESFLLGQASGSGLEKGPKLQT